MDRWWWCPLHRTRGFWWDCTRKAQRSRKWAVLACIFTVDSIPIGLYSVCDLLGSERSIPGNYPRSPSDVSTPCTFNSHFLFLLQTSALLYRPLQIVFFAMNIPAAIVRKANIPCSVLFRVEVNIPYCKTVLFDRWNVTLVLFKERQTILKALYLVISTKLPLLPNSTKYHRYAPPQCPCCM